MKKGICYIVGAGENFGLDFTPGDGDLVIAADGGLEYLKKAGITPDVIIGDFDSLGYAPEGENVIKLNVCKNETDALSAAEYGLDKGYAEFRLYCGTGGRTDHTIANIQLLTYLAKRNAKGYLFDKDSVLTVIKNGEYNFDSDCTGFLSVFSLSDKSSGVYLENLKYELSDAVLTSDYALGTSNEFILGKAGSIKVKDGTLLIVFPRKRRV